MKTTFLLLLSTLILHANSFASSGPDAILGEWLSQEKDGKISIYKQGDKFYGKITWSKTPGKKDINNPIFIKTLLYLFLNSLHCFKVALKKYFTPGSVNIGLENSSKFIINTNNKLK